MTHEDVRKALYRIAFDGDIDRNSSHDATEILLEKIRAHVVSWSQNVQERNEVVLCDKCKGRGTVERDELKDYHKREYNTWTEACKPCGGSGRVQVTTLVRRQPYQPLMPDRLT